MLENVSCPKICLNLISMLDLRFVQGRAKQNLDIPVLLRLSSRLHALVAVAAASERSSLSMSLSHAMGYTSVITCLKLSWPFALSWANIRSIWWTSLIHKWALEYDGAAHPDWGEFVHHRSNEADDALIQDIKTIFGQSGAPLPKYLILAAEASEAATLLPAAIVRVSWASCAVNIKFPNLGATTASVECSA